MKYRHFRPAWAYELELPAVTVALDLELGLAGITMCSPKDQFCKKTGRDLAVDRISLIPSVEDDGGIIGIPRVSSSEYKRILWNAVMWVTDQFLNNGEAGVHIYPIDFEPGEEKQDASIQSEA